MRDVNRGGDEADRPGSIGNPDMDNQLILRIQEDDTQALATLIQRYAQRLEASAFLLVHRDDLAQDAVQDVFIKLWAQRSNLDIRGPVSHYLFRAVRFRAISIIRHEGAVHRLEEALLHAQQFVDLTATNHGTANIEQREFAQVVSQTLQSLPKRCREIFLMHRVAEMSYGEIAASLEITSATVHNQMYRASKALMAALRKQGMI